MKFSLQSFQREYETDATEVVIRGKRFSFLRPSSIERYVDPDDMFHNFPLWSKVWEASIVLADYLAGLEQQPEKQYLEIGAGMGFVGVVAAAFGHRITVTESNLQAVDFVRANAAINNSSNLEIIQMDWNAPQLEARYDYIVGSEVVYHERDFRPLQTLFNNYLKPEGELILCSEARKITMEFYRRLQSSFAISAQKKKIRSQEGEIPVILCRMTAKN